MNKTTSAFLSGGAVLAAAYAGRRAGPEHPREAAWYAALDKPGYTPSGATIGAVWTGLDLLSVVSGARLLQAAPSRERSTALLFWSLNLAGIAGWPWMFFRGRKLGASAAATVGMLACARASAASAGKVDRIAALAAMPQIGWLGFAGLLGEAIWRKNRKP